MKNCRNCGHAGWSYNEAGTRRLFNNWAPCNASLDAAVAMLPASASIAAHALTKGQLSVIYSNKEIDCNRWVKIDKEVKGGD